MTQGLVKGTWYLALANDFGYDFHVRSLVQIWYMNINTVSAYWWIFIWNLKWVRIPFCLVEQFRIDFTSSLNIIFTTKINSVIYYQNRLLKVYSMGKVHVFLR